MSVGRSLLIDGSTVMSTPNHCGGGTERLDWAPFPMSDSFPMTISVMATAPARVTTASCNPRIRTAGIAMRRPTATAMHTPKSIAIGEGKPGPSKAKALNPYTDPSAANRLERYAATPAKVRFASESCPR